MKLLSVTPTYKYNTNTINIIYKLKFKLRTYGDNGNVSNNYFSQDAFFQPHNITVRLNLIKMQSMERLPIIRGRKYTLRHIHEV